MFPSASTIAEELDMQDRGQVLCSENGLLLIPAGHGWVIRLVVEPELVRVLTGAGVRILVGEDASGDLSPLKEVVSAVMNGDLEEYFGPSDEGPLDSIGHRLWYPGGERVTGRERVLARVRAPAWS